MSGAGIQTPTTVSAGGLRVSMEHTRGDFRLSARLDCPERGITAIFGPSGCGKSTLLRCIAGLEHPSRADISLAGETWQETRTGFFLPVHRRRLGVVFQEATLFPHLDVRGNLEFGLSRRRGPDTPGTLGQVAALLGIEHLLDRGTAHLSGGERQRIAIARALLASPQLLLMDEPLASLDLQRRREILPLLERINAELGLPILYVTHSPEEVVRLADYLVLMEQGRVIAQGPLAQTLSRLDLPEDMADDFGGVVHGFCSGYDADYGLLSLQFCGGTLRLPHVALPTGTRLRARIRSRDIALSLSRPPDSSVLNLLEAEVTEESRTDGEAHIRVRLDCGGTPLVARITRFSHDRLEIRPGLRLWAQVKAVAIAS